MTYPMIRLEIQGMKHAVQVALSDYAAKMNSEIQAAIEAACTAQHITAIIEETARREVDSAIRQEIERFFRYGDGRETIKAAVAAMLAKREPL